MKACPYCAEEIQDAAIKCKHCGSMLAGPGPASAPTSPAPAPPPAVVRTKSSGAGFKVVGTLLAIGGVCAMPAGASSAGAAMLLIGIAVFVVGRFHDG